MMRSPSAPMKLSVCAISARPGAYWTISTPTPPTAARCTTAPSRTNTRKPSFGSRPTCGTRATLTRRSSPQITSAFGPEAGAEHRRLLRGPARRHAGRPERRDRGIRARLPRRAGHRAAERRGRRTDPHQHRPCPPRRCGRHHHLHLQNQSPALWNGWTICTAPRARCC